MDLKLNEAFSSNPSFNLGQSYNQNALTRPQHQFSQSQVQSVTNNMSDLPQTDFSQASLMAANYAERPVYNKSVNYYHEFWKMYLENEVLISKMKDSVVKSKEMQARLFQLRAQCHELELNILASKKEAAKKKRRPANEITKTFTCPYEGCQKQYGSDVSLNLHIKLKHGGGNKTERERLAKIIIEAKLKGEDLPEVTLNLPPGFFESIDLEKLGKLKDKKDKGKTKEDFAKDMSDLKILLKEHQMSESDLTTLLTDFSKNLLSDNKKE